MTPQLAHRENVGRRISRKPSNPPTIATLVLVLACLVPGGCPPQASSTGDTSVADADGDTSVADADGVGWPDAVELAVGANPQDASTPGYPMPANKEIADGIWRWEVINDGNAQNLAELTVLDGVITHVRPFLLRMDSSYGVLLDGSIDFSLDGTLYDIPAPSTSKVSVTPPTDGSFGFVVTEHIGTTINTFPYILTPDSAQSSADLINVTIPASPPNQPPLRLRKIG